MLSAVLLKPSILTGGPEHAAQLELLLGRHVVNQRLALFRRHGMIRYTNGTWANCGNEFRDLTAGQSRKFYDRLLRPDQPF